VILISYSIKQYWPPGGIDSASGYFRSGWRLGSKDHRRLYWGLIDRGRIAQVAALETIHHGGVAAEKKEQ
jgi:hypothetical protein